MENISVLNFRNETKNFLIENFPTFKCLVFLNKMKLVKFLKKMIFNRLSHSLPVFETISKISLSLISGKNESKSLESTTINFFKESDSIWKTKLSNWTEVFLLNISYRIDFLNVKNFRFISVLKLVVIVVKIDSLHKEIKRTWSFFYGLEISHWWMFALHLIRMFTVHLIWVFTLHLIGVIFMNVINIREVILFNGRLRVVVITRVERVLRQIACILPDFAPIWKFTL